MSYQEKRTIVSMITGVLLIVAYLIYTYGKYQSGDIATDNLKFWAATMLIFIGIGIASAIIIQIVFHILLSIGIAIKQQIENGTCDDHEIDQTIKAEMITDEMDKLIELKSMRVGFIVAGIGFITALTSQIINYSPAVMINILFIAFSAGSVLDGATQLYYYRKGV